MSRWGTVNESETKRGKRTSAVLAHLTALYKGAGAWFLLLFFFDGTALPCTSATVSSLLMGLPEEGHLGCPNIIGSYDTVQFEFHLAPAANSTNAACSTVEEVNK